MALTLTSALSFKKYEKILIFSRKLKAFSSAFWNNYLQTI